LGLPLTLIKIQHEFHPVSLRPAAGPLPLLPSLVAVAAVAALALGGSGVCGLRPLSAPQAYRVGNPAFPLGKIDQKMPKDGMIPGIPSGVKHGYLNGKSVEYHLSLGI